MLRKKYCGTAAKAGGNGENKHHPTVKGVSCLLTKFATFLEVNGALYGGSRKARRFELPDRQTIYRSVRFGDHAFDVKRKSMMIIPVMSGPRVESVSMKPKVLASAGPSSVAKGLWRDKPAGKLDERSMAEAMDSFVYRIMSWHMWLSRIIKTLLGCKEQEFFLFRGTGRSPLSRIELERSGTP